MYGWESARKFYKTTSGINSACGDNPVLIGGIGEINFGKQFRQGNRVYDSEHIAMCLLSQPVGNTGGHSYLYKVNNENFQKPQVEWILLVVKNTSV